MFLKPWHSKLMEKAYEITPNDGKTIFVGVPNDKISIYSLPLAFDKKIEVSHGETLLQTRDTKIYKAEENKGIDYKKFITDEFDLKDVNDAIKLFRSGKAGRIILKISKED